MSADRVLSQLLGSGAATGFAGGLAGGLASGLLTSKSGRKFGKKALKLGGIAAVGGLAYSAWSRYQNDQAGAAVGTPQANGPAGMVPQAPVSPERFVPPASQTADAEQLGLTLLRAMVAAAQADGRLDGGERHAIFERVGKLDISDGEKASLLAQLDQPVDLNELVAEARTPEIAAEIYTASLLAIDVDTRAERAYLGLLAARLGLADGLVDSIHQELEAVGAGAVASAGQDAA